MAKSAKGVPLLSCFVRPHNLPDDDGVSTRRRANLNNSLPFFSRKEFVLDIENVSLLCGWCGGVMICCL